MINMAKFFDGIEIVPSPPSVPTKPRIMNHRLPPREHVTHVDEPVSEEFLDFAKHVASYWQKIGGYRGAAEHTHLDAEGEFHSDPNFYTPGPPVALSENTRQAIAADVKRMFDAAESTGILVDRSQEWRVVENVCAAVWEEMEKCALPYPIRTVEADQTVSVTITSRRNEHSASEGYKVVDEREKLPTRYAARQQLSAIEVELGECLYIRCPKCGSGEVETFEGYVVEGYGGALAKHLEFIPPDDVG